MRPSDELFQLLKSLTKSEKRLIQLLLPKYEGSKSRYSIQLFRILSRQRNYNERELRKKLLPKASRILPQLKIYLWNRIMQILRMQSLNNENDIYNKLCDGNILLEKRLYKLAEKSFKQAEDISAKYNRYLQLLIAFELRQQMKYDQFISFNDNDIINDLEFEKQLLKHRICEIKLKYIYYKLWSIHKINPQLEIQDPLSNFELKEWFENLKYSDLITFKSKFYFLRSHSLISNFKGKIVESVSFYHKIVQLFDQYPEFKNVTMPKYQISLINYLAACHRIKDYSSFEIILQQISKLHYESSEDEARLFADAMFYELLFLMNTRQLERASRLLPDICYKFTKYERYLKSSRIISFWFNIAVVHFLCEDFDYALDYINKAIDLKSELRRDLRHNFMILQIIIHIEKNAYKLLPSLFRTLIRELRQESMYAGYISIVVKNLKYLATIDTKISRTKFYTKFIRALLHQKQHNPERTYPLQDELLYWLQSKISNKSILETVQKNEIYQNKHV